MKTRFFKLQFGEKFIYAGRILQKESTFFAVTAFGSRDEVAVWPWTRVRVVSPETDPLLFLMARDAARFDAEMAKALSRPSPWMDVVDGGMFPASDLQDASRMAYRAATQRTHYFGDGCFPPHDEGRLKAYTDDNRTGPSA